MSGFDFKQCPHCGGYGVRDNGRNCVTCGGSGSGGLLSTNGVIGSGEVIHEKATGRIVTHKEFAEIMAKQQSGDKHE